MCLISIVSFDEQQSLDDEQGSPVARERPGDISITGTAFVYVVTIDISNVVLRGVLGYIRSEGLRSPLRHSYKR